MRLVGLIVFGGGIKFVARCQNVIVMINGGCRLHAVCVGGGLQTTRDGTVMYVLYDVQYSTYSARCVLYTKRAENYVSSRTQHSVMYFVTL